jgi:hypothetical protein
MVQIQRNEMKGWMQFPKNEKARLDFYAYTYIHEQIAVAIAK